MLLLERPWTSQPDGFARPNPDALARNLVHLSIADFTQEYASGGQFVATTITSGTVSTEATPWGRGRANTGASSNNQTRQVVTNGDFTILYVGSATSASTRYAMYQSGSAGEVAVGLNFDDQFAASAGRMSLTMLQTGVNRSHAYVASAIGATEELKAYVWRKRGASISAWINGVPQTVVTSGGFTGLPTASADTFSTTGRSGDGAKRWSGSSSTSVLVATAVYNTAQSDDYCARLSRFPDFYGQLFAPRRIWVPAAAASTGTPTLSAATYVPGSITSSGFTTRVTITF